MQTGDATKDADLAAKFASTYDEFHRIVPDPNDPQAGCKIAQNFNFASNMGGGGGATFTLNGIDGNGEFRRIKTFIHSQIFQGRHGS